MAERKKQMDDDDTDEEYPDFNPPPFPKEGKSDVKDFPRAPDDTPAEMQVLAPAYLEDVNDQPLQFRLERFIKRTHPEQRVQSYVINDAGSPRLGVMRGHRTVAEYFAMSQPVYKRCDEILSKGPRRVLFRPGGQLTSVFKGKQVDALILELPLAKLDPETAYKYIKEVPAFFAVYWGTEGKPQIATHKLAMDRLDKKVIPAVQDALKWKIDNLPDDIVEQMDAAVINYDKNRIAKEYRKPFVDAFEFTVSVLQDEKAFMADKTAAAEGVENLKKLLRPQAIVGEDLDENLAYPLGNFINAAQEQPMDPKYDYFGVQYLSRDYHQLVQAVFVAEIAWRWVAKGWQQRVFIRLRTSSFTANLSTDYFNKAVHGWLYSDEEDAFEDIPYILPALYAIHPELLLQKGISAFKPVVRQMFQKTVEQRSEKRNKGDDWDPDIGDQDLGSKGALTKMPGRLLPMMMAYVNGKYH